MINLGSNCKIGYNAYIIFSEMLAKGRSSNETMQGSEIFWADISH
jgi:hypothetical protein